MSRRRPDELTKALIIELTREAARQLDEAIEDRCRADREESRGRFETSRYWITVGDEHYATARGVLIALERYRAVSDPHGEGLLPSTAIGVYLWTRWFIHLGHAPAHVAEQTTSVEAQS